jgi:hypothetical protein
MHYASHIVYRKHLFDIGGANSIKDWCDFSIKQILYKSLTCVTTDRRCAKNASRHGVFPEPLVVPHDGKAQPNHDFEGDTTFGLITAEIF